MTENRHTRKFNRRQTLLITAFICGVLTVIYFYSWWLQDERYRSPFLIMAFIPAFLYSAIPFVGNWWLYIVARRLPYEPVNNKYSVDVFVTAYKEELPLVERCLAAACGMKGDHQTWLLDDGDDPELEKLAERLGAGYLTRLTHEDAKAGNINAALQRTKGDIVVIFDIDHVPSEDFLECTLGHFDNPEVGFVQVMVTFSNSSESWVAKASLESSLEFYNPTYLGSDYYGSATLMGTNALIRRTALEQIGGYKPGLAEDLATSIALHAAGWRSGYVAEPLAPGLAPPDLTAWFVQQLKWARGVFELLVTAYPKYFPRLNHGQRLSYAVRMTKYWIGPAVALHLFATIFVLIFGGPATRAHFHAYLNHLAPLVLADVVIRAIALRMWLHPKTSQTSMVQAVVLIYSTWPVYLLAWLMALTRIPLSFRPTPKQIAGRLNPIWLLPQMITMVLLLVGVVYSVLAKHHPPSLLLIFAILQSALLLFLLVRQGMVEMMQRKPHPRGSPVQMP